MISSIRSFAAGTTDIAPEMRAGLGQMARAVEYARELECDVWDFAVEIDRLFALGLTTSDLRWLIKRGFVRHARESTAKQDSVRRFDSPDMNLAFASNTCFVITNEGVEAIQGNVNVKSHRLGQDDYHNRELEVRAGKRISAASDFDEESAPILADRADFGTPDRATNVPNWDHDARTLQVGEYTIKRFRVPSPNQESVLNAFQEEGWPHSIDDPLSPVPDQQPKRRLRDTIKCLNLNQAVRRIRFRGDGTGQRVLWELLDEPARTVSTKVRHPSQSSPVRRAA